MSSGRRSAAAQALRSFDARKGGSTDDVDRERAVKSAADQKHQRSFADSLDKCEVCAPSDNKAVIYCVNCEVRFCADCDKIHRRGALTKHRCVPYITKGKKGGRMGFFGDSEFGEEIAHDQAERNKRLLREMVFLLRHKQSTAPDFLRYKLQKDLDRQLRVLVNESLKASFDELHKSLDEKEYALAHDILAWKKSYAPLIEQQVRIIEKGMQEDSKLVEQGEFALTQSNEYLLESRNVATLIDNMHDAIKRDTVKQVQILEAHTSVASFQAMGSDSVKRAIERLYVGKPEEELRPGKEQSTFITSDEKAFVPLRPFKLKYSKATGASVRMVNDLWAKRHPGTDVISNSTELKNFVKALCDHLDKNVPLADEYTQKIFYKYDQVPNLATLKADVMDKLQEVFGEMYQSYEDIYYQIQERVITVPNTANVTKSSVAQAWAHTVEVEITKGVFSMQQRESGPLGLQQQSE